MILWSSVESAVGIISSSLPSLRKLFGHYFDSKGSTYHREQSGAGRGGAQRTIGGTPFTASQSGTQHELETVGSGERKIKGGGTTAFITSKGGRGRGWDQLDDDDSGHSSVQGIAMQTSIRVDVESVSEQDLRATSSHSVFKN